MSNDATWQRLNEIFQEFFDDPTVELRAETTAEDIEDWDSISHVELMLAIEEAFGVRFRTAEIASLANVGELVDRIEAQRAGA